VDLFGRLDLPEPERLGRRYPHQVSGGQLQRLMAAMALCGEPELLILDEPTTALDVTTQIEVLGAFKDVIRDLGTAAIYITHDLALVAQIADRVIVLRGGQSMETGDTEQVIARPAHSYTRQLMAASRPPPAASARIGAARAERAEQSSLVAVTDVTAGYGRVVGGGVGTTVLRNVNVTVEKGSVVGIIGESGCGKSTLARVIAGLLPSYRGDVTLDAEHLPRSVAERALATIQRVQIVFQMADTALNPRQRVGEIVGRPLELYLGLGGRARDERVAELLRMVELPEDLAGRYPEALSGGQKQRVNLARALAASPDLVLCDEVTSGLDTIVGAAVIALLKQVRAELSVSYLFISHDISTGASFADHIVVLYAGRVVEQGATADVLSPPHHPYTRLLLSSVPELRPGWLEEVTGSREAAAAVAAAVEITEVGCPFHTRCPLAVEGLCDTTQAPERASASGHLIACHWDLEDLGGE
jgi:peptide/nickel transport system ATP-binding protein